MNDVTVVGAGLGGLSAALCLASAGKKVTLFEKNPAVGGKMNLATGEGYRFDTGPTLLTMPFVLKSLFLHWGEVLEDHLELLPVDPSCRYFFSDGAQLDIAHSMDKTLENLSRFSPGETGNVKKFLEHGKKIYHLAAGPFLFDTFGEWTPGYFLRNWKALLRLGGLDAFRTLHKAACSFFSDSRLIQLFGRFATYNGSSPYRTPATFAIIPFVEWMFGGWYVKGGLYRIAEVMRDLAQRKGVDIRTGMEVKEIVSREGKVTGLRMGDESLFETSAVVMNADALSVYEKLLKEPKALQTAKRLRKSPLSLSGFVLMLGVDKTYAPLGQHNIFFSANYRKEFEEIFEKQVPPSDPTIYISVSSKNDPSMAPPGCSNLFVLINVPPQNTVYDWTNNASGYRDRIIELLEKKGLKDLRKHIRFEKMITPDDLEQKYRAFRGTIYGLASHDRWSSFRRPPNRSREVQGLYFAGGSTHPGGGIPLVLLSGKTVSELILKKRIPIHD